MKFKSFGTDSVGIHYWVGEEKLILGHVMHL